MKASKNSFTNFFYSCKFKTNNNNQNKNDNLGSFVTSYLIDSNRLKLGSSTRFRIDTSYYPSEVIQRVKTYIDTSANGYAFEFYKNGQINQLNFYVDGQWTGIQKKFFKSGKLEYFGGFKNGFPKYDQTFFYENGNIKSSYRIINDSMVGSQYFYNENGSLKAYIFSNVSGHRKYHRLYNSIGNLINEDGNPIGNFAIIFHDSFDYHIQDTVHFLIFVATPPKCSFFLRTIEKTGLYPEFTLSNIPKNDKNIESDYILKKEGRYNFRLTYTITDSITNKKTEYSRELNITVTK